MRSCCRNLFLRWRVLYRRYAGYMVHTPIVLVAASLLSAFSGCAHTRAFKSRDGRVLAGSIARMETVEIGGIRQSMWLRSTDTSNLPLIFLHGGPGISEAPLFRYYNGDVERCYLAVYWEQRGAGRSFHRNIPPSSMNLDQFLADLDEVVDLVRHEFNDEKVVLLAHSWGTVLGTIYAYRHPDKVAAYVGTGQIANMQQGERLSYDFALGEARRRNDRGALRELRKMGAPPHTVKSMLKSRRSVERFGGTFHGKLSTGKLIWTALKTDEADLTDLVRFGAGNRFSLHHLWPEFSHIDLESKYRVFRVPVFFLIGRYDRVTPADLAERYFSNIEAPYKRLVWFEDSAHNPMYEEPGHFNQVLIDDVLPVAKQTIDSVAPNANVRPSGRN
jgi:proline iminopeptidase